MNSEANKQSLINQTGQGMRVGFNALGLIAVEIYDTVGESVGGYDRRLLPTDTATGAGGRRQKENPPLKPF